MVDAVVLFAALEVEQAECVADDDQGGAFVDEYDRADVQAEEGGEDEERDGLRHDVTRYMWWAGHEGSSTAHDHTFATKRQALLFVAKRNSEQMGPPCCPMLG